jgi:hypothetical protein
MSSILSSHLLSPTLPPLLLSLEVVQQHVPLLALLTPIADNHAAAVDDLAGIPLTIQHAESSPFAEHLSIRHLDERDFVFGAQSNDELLVGFLLTSFVQNAHVGLSAVEGFGGFAQAAGETIVNESETEDT